MRCPLKQEAELADTENDQLVEVRVELDALLAVLLLRIGGIVKDVAGVEKHRFPEMQRVAMVVEKSVAGQLSRLHGEVSVDHQPIRVMVGEDRRGDFRPLGLDVNAVAPVQGVYVLEHAAIALNVQITARPSTTPIVRGGRARAVAVRVSAMRIVLERREDDWQ